MITFPRIGSLIETLNFEYAWESVEKYVTKPFDPCFSVEQRSVGMIVDRQKIEHGADGSSWHMVKILWTTETCSWVLEQPLGGPPHKSTRWYRKLTKSHV